MDAKTPLPSIPDLFKESWDVFKESFLNLLWLFLISIGTYLIVAVAFVVILFILGIGSFIGAQNPEAAFMTLLTNPIALGGLVIAAIVAVVLLVIIGTLFQIANAKAVFDPEKKVPVLSILKSSQLFIWPVFTVSFISGLIAAGGFGLLFIPGLIISLIFSFSTYEVLFNNQKGLDAIKRSYALFETNFWGILGRLALFALISGIITFAISRNNQMGAIAAIVNTIVSWFGICYSVTLYKQVSKGREHLPGKSIKVIVMLSILGFILIGLFIAATTNMAMNNIKRAPADDTNMIPKLNQDMTHPEGMPKMMEQLPQDGPMTPDQSI